MYKRELDGLIAANKLPKSFMIYGECEYINSLYANKISSLSGNKNDILSFYFDEYGFQGAKNHIAQSSLFGDKNVLFVKSEKGIPKKELDALVEVCKKNENSFFIYQFYGENKKANDQKKSFSKKNSADFVRFFKPSKGEAILLLKEKAKELNLDIDNYALGHLYEIQSEDLSLSENELKKLSLANKKIEAKDIDNLIYGLGSENIENLIEDIFEKKDIKDKMAKILESGLSNEVGIINAIENFTVQLFLFYSYIKINGSHDARAILGYPLPPVLSNKRAHLCKKFNADIYKKILNHLTKTELAIKKSANMEKTSYLISSLIKLQRLL